MRAGFIPARPERKERNMAVPASKRARAMGEYVRQARIVLSETQHVMRIAYEAYTAAYGRINTLAGLRRRPQPRT